MNKLINGIEYRATKTGYLVKHKNREIYIIAKSVTAGEKARNIIANLAKDISFNQLFKKTKRGGLLGANIGKIYL